MTHRQTETSREIRLWIRDIIVPAIGVGSVVLAMHPELKEKAKDKYVNMKRKIETRKIKIVK